MLCSNSDTINYNCIRVSKTSHMAGLLAETCCLRYYKYIYISHKTKVHLLVFDTFYISN